MDTRPGNYIKCALLNVQSVGNKTLEINDLIKEKDLSILALTETWLSKKDTAKIFEMTPDSHTFVHVPREDKRGGGVGLFLSKTIKKIACKQLTLKQTFEVMCTTCEVNKIKCMFIVIYRPPHTNVHSFINEFQQFLETIDMVSAQVIICGDFNIWIDNINDPLTKNFIDLMSSFGLVNKVQNATSISGHILDLVFCESNCDIIKEIIVDEVCDTSPVHKLITFTLPMITEKNQRKKITYRLKSRLQPELLISTLIEKLSHEQQEICIHNIAVSDCINCTVKLFNEILKQQYDSQCPLVEKKHYN